MAIRKKHVIGKECRLTSLTPARVGELESVNSSGWCRGPIKTNMRFRTGKGSVVVVDALNGDSAVQWVMESVARLSPESRRTVEYPAGERHDAGDIL